MPDQTLGDRVGALEDAARSIALQLNGDPDLRIPGRLEQIERELAAQRTQIDRLSNDIAATAQRRRELQNALNIAADEIHSRIDQMEKDTGQRSDATDKDHAGQINALGRRYYIVLILALANIAAGIIASAALYMLYLELVR